MSALPNPTEPNSGSDQQPISLAAERARAQLHEEIERVRGGIEEMLAEQGRAGAEDAALRRELEDLREDTRLYVKKRAKRTERKLEARIDDVAERTGEVEERTERLEVRIGEVEAERTVAEVRIHAATELMLDDLLQEMRTIADLLTLPRDEPGGG